MRFRAARFLFPRVAAVAVAAGACSLLATSRAPRGEPPRVTQERAGDGGVTPAAAAPAPAGGAQHVVYRFTEHLGDAKLDAPSFDRALTTLRAHWRRLGPPFTPASPRTAPYLTTVALRTSAHETQATMPIGGGKAWRPDARIWNMNEGSFDQRESILAPSGSAYAFDVTVPSGATFVASPGTVNATRDTTVFTVRVVSADGASRDLCAARVPPALARRWSDLRCDLSALGGARVTLVLSVTSEPPTDADRAVASPVPADKPRRRAPDAAGEDGGAPLVETLASPGAPVAALWGNPELRAPSASALPYNVLFVVVDALRPDVIASMHVPEEDARARAARVPPLEARLPRIEGLTPNIDALVRRGARFTSAYSAACWTRPGTLAMLTGARSSELGIDTLQWAIRPPQPGRFYESNPPLLPLLARRRGATAAAFVNNYFMVGYAAVGVDMGFERLEDHRYRTRDTLEITRSATEFLRANRDTRFFAFVNYNSPHEPYEPPKEMLDRVPKPPEGPADPGVRAYMAEAAKDDEAIGVLLRTLDELDLTKRTIVVLTADHGETLSAAHVGTSLLDRMPIRYHHAVSNFEETTRVPIVIAAPGLVPEGASVRARVRTTDLAPTLVELLGLERSARMSGRSLLGLVRGEAEEPRVVVSEGRGSRAILHGKHRLVVREGKVRTTIRRDGSRTVSEELFDLEADPGEREDLAPQRPDLVRELKARLSAELAGVPVAGSAAALAPDPVQPAPALRMRFVGGGRPRRVSGTITFGAEGASPKSVKVTPVELGEEVVRVSGARVELSLVTSPSAVVGVDLVVDPPSLPAAFDLYLDDAPFPPSRVHGGAWGFAAPALARGVFDDATRAAAAGAALPYLDPHRDDGLFVVRSASIEEPAAGDGDGEGARELERLLREWGYAHGGADAGR